MAGLNTPIGPKPIAESWFVRKLVEAKDIPVEPAPVRDQLTGNAVADAQVLAIGLLQWKAVAVQSLALLKGCVG